MTAGVGTAVGVATTVGAGGVAVDGSGIAVGFMVGVAVAATVPLAIVTAIPRAVTPSLVNPSGFQAPTLRYHVPFASAVVSHCADWLAFGN